jgi:hypothetical protein
MTVPLLATSGWSVWAALLGVQEEVGNCNFFFDRWVFGHRATALVGFALINVSQFFFPADHGNRAHSAVIFDRGSWANKLVVESTMYLPVSLDHCALPFGTSGYARVSPLDGTTDTGARPRHLTGRACDTRAQHTN